ncbi:Glycosyl hydrolases family 43 [Microbacterium hydrocarbonoxydans]|uniref:Glycosyl hydrolases family 43 n=1 Tax=Microbacterium hydrocarbonoxydans TaxID=273678 RepID=A0A0M2HUU2_9MICO|nr:immunoglobulin-like domain-containing protein [Microbacterium hydrocarbonoxydans]KJL48690.1 Glycosyl hydrolases family 43 [Microbacterium hydrocarbonoxydans]
MTNLLAASARKTAAVIAAAATIVAIGAVSSHTASAAAEGPAPLIHYSFDSAAGGTVGDLSGNGYDGVIKQSGASVAGGQLTLPGGARATAGYLEIPTAGLVGKQQLTVSTWLTGRSGPANTAAAFIGAPVASGASYSSAYWLLNPTNPSGYVKSVLTNTVSATAPWGTEVGAGSTNAATSGIKTPAGLSLYTTVIDGVAGTLTTYVNGTQISAVPIARNISSFGSNLVSYLGRSTYNDPGWAGDVDDFAVYATALSASDVTSLYTGQALDRAVAGVTVPGSATSSFTLPTSSSGVSVSWASDNAAIQVSGGTATVTRPSAGSADAVATLTATFTVGGATTTRTYSVTVPAELSDQAKADADLAAVSISGAGDVRTALSVATAGANGSSLSWSVVSGTAVASIEEGVKAGSATVAITRPAGADATVVLAVTATVGAATASKQITLTVKQAPTASAEKEAYVWAFFTGEGAGAERVSLAASKGNDALRWNTLNDGEPIFTSTQGTTGLRDPFIIRSHEGDKFYMLATDLKVAGLAGGFTTAQISGSRAIEVWESTDLVNWSAQRHVEVSSAYAGNTWAPEAYWDDEIGRYVVFWASNLYPTTDVASRTAVTYNRMIYVTTDDFVTFSEPQIWSDVKRGTGLGLIDSTVAEHDGTYYRFTKDEASMTIREEKSTDLLATISGTLPGTSGAADEWTLVQEKIATGLPNGEPGGTYSSGEGPSIFPSNPGDVNGFDWYLFIDQPNYHGGPNHYIPFGSTDITNGASWQPLGSILRENLPQNSDGGKPRHGTVIPVTRAEYQTVLEGFAPEIAVTEVAPITASTRAGTAPVLPKATLTTASGATSTVDVSWEGVDPADYAAAGTFTVRGIAQDASRMPVTATVTVTPGISLDLSTRCVAGKVVVAATVANAGSAAAHVTVSSAYGEKVVDLAGGKSTTVTFSTRAASVASGSVQASVDGATVATAAYGSRTC